MIWSHLAAWLELPKASISINPLWGLIECSQWMRLFALWGLGENCECWLVAKGVIVELYVVETSTREGVKCGAY